MPALSFPHYEDTVVSPNCDGFHFSILDENDTGDQIPVDDQMEDSEESPNGFDDDVIQKDKELGNTLDLPRDCRDMSVVQVCWFLNFMKDLLGLDNDFARLVVKREIDGRALCSMSKDELAKIFNYHHDVDIVKEYLESWQKEFSDKKTYSDLESVHSSYAVQSPIEADKIEDVVQFSGNASHSDCYQSTPTESPTNNTSPLQLDFLILGSQQNTYAEFLPSSSTEMKSNIDFPQPPRESCCGQTNLSPVVDEVRTRGRESRKMQLDFEVSAGEAYSGQVTITRSSETHCHHTEIIHSAVGSVYDQSDFSQSDKHLENFQVDHSSTVSCTKNGQRLEDSIADYTELEQSLSNSPSRPNNEELHAETNNNMDYHSGSDAESSDDDGDDGEGESTSENERAVTVRELEKLDLSRTTVSSPSVVSSPPILRRKRGRPRKERTDGGRTKKEKKLLWKFLLNHLNGGEYRRCVQWTDREQGMFKFISKEKEDIARQWGVEKRHKNVMTYQKMARALRNYTSSQSKIMERCPGKLQYKFAHSILHSAYNKPN